GHLTAARDHFTALLDYGTRGLGVADTDLWHIRYFLADIRGHAGETAGAAEDLRALLAELNPTTPPSWWGAATSHAAWTRRVTWSDALAELRALLSDQERLLRLDDPAH
ncbi:MAG: hypothetical protein M3548_01145, partial [Actinomycetota bacterium]|nr:hypothetical protein [Actinomycetota bacterium]